MLFRQREVSGVARENRPVGLGRIGGFFKAGAEGDRMRGGAARRVKVGTANFRDRVSRFLDSAGKFHKSSTGAAQHISNGVQKSAKAMRKSIKKARKQFK